MFKFFDFISTLISTVIGFIEHTIQSVFVFIGQIVTGITFLTNTILNLPPFCQGFLLTIVSVSVIAMLIKHFVDLG